MNKTLRCFKCWNDTARLTYEENRIYKVACECGCEYEFEHSSFACAEMYHYKMLELYGEIDKNVRLTAQVEAMKMDRNVLEESLINKEMNLDRMTAQAEALEKRIKGNELFERAKMDCWLNPPEYCARANEIEQLEAELAKYREAEQDGRLVVLPCKVGDAVFWADNIEGENVIHDGIIANFNVDNERGELWAYVRYSDGLNYHHKVSHYFEKSVFLTREEAEAALKEGTE